jgi:hypothetical protein
MGQGTAGASKSSSNSDLRFSYRTAGDVKFGINKTFAIKVTNIGDGTLRFKEEPYVEVLEGC